MNVLKMNKKEQVSFEILETVFLILVILIIQ
jgi:hypothetical protein